MSNPRICACRHPHPTFWTHKAHDDLQKRFVSDVPGLEVVAPTGTEKRHLVASGPMTEEDAKAACAKLKKAHAQCEVVKR